MQPLTMIKSDTYKTRAEWAALGRIVVDNPDRKVFNEAGEQVFYLLQTSTQKVIDKVNTMNFWVDEMPH